MTKYHSVTVNGVTIDKKLTQIPIKDPIISAKDQANE